MKTNYPTNLKDNVAAAILMTTVFIAIMGSIVASNDARADKAAPQMNVQILETMLVTALRVEQVVRMETIVVTASRTVEATPTFLVAAK